MIQMRIPMKSSDESRASTTSDELDTNDSEDNDLFIEELNQISLDE